MKSFRPRSFDERRDLEIKLVNNGDTACVNLPMNFSRKEISKLEYYKLEINFATNVILIGLARF